METLPTNEDRRRRASKCLERERELMRNNECVLDMEKKRARPREEQ